MASGTALDLAPESLFDLLCHTTQSDLTGHAWTLPLEWSSQIEHERMALHHGRVELLIRPERKVSAQLVPTPEVLDWTEPGRLRDHVERLKEQKPLDYALKEERILHDHAPWVLILEQKQVGSETDQVLCTKTGNASSPSERWTLFDFPRHRYELLFGRLESGRSMPPGTVSAALILKSRDQSRVFLIHVEIDDVYAQREIQQKQGERAQQAQAEQKRDMGPPPPMLPPVGGLKTSKKKRRSRKAVFGAPKKRKKNA